MTAEQKLLLENLLDRLDADAESQHSQYRRIVSDKEREALRSLLTEPATVPQPLDPPAKPVPEPVDQPIETGGESGPDTSFKLNTEALRYQASPAPNWTLCLDFGTAKSKAFAATDDEEEPELLPLPIGKADGDLDGSVHEVSSSVWIDDDGLLFMGSEAVKRGINFRDSKRRRLDSLKQEISQLHPESDPVQLHRKLPEEVDPTSTLTYSDAITSYLAYLTDLATTVLNETPRVGTRYTPRRFTLPWWNKSQRQWSGKFLTKRLKRAQIIADSFHGKWHSGIHVDEIKRILRDVAAHDEKLSWLVRAEPESGVLEPLAAASARVWNDQSARNVMIVVDVGAGTTDISLFWVVQQIPPDRLKKSSPEKLELRRQAWPIKPCGTAIKQAGDTLDSLLVAELIRKANLGEDTALRRRVTDSLFRKGVRQLKERLFETGEIRVVLVSDHIVKLTIKEFMNLQGVNVFEQLICGEIGKLLEGVDKSWKSAAEHGITLVLTGGGCRLPMIRNLANRRWKIGGQEVVCRLAADLPADLANRSIEFIREYPRLTVAMGGALKMLLDEGEALCKWQGGARSRRAVTGRPRWV